MSYYYLYIQFVRSIYHHINKGNIRYRSGFVMEDYFIRRKQA